MQNVLQAAEGMLEEETMAPKNNGEPPVGNIRVIIDPNELPRPQQEEASTPSLSRVFLLGWDRAVSIVRPTSRGSGPAEDMAPAEE